MSLTFLYLAYHAVQGAVDSCEVKIADFGLSALVRLDEDGYDAEESGKRKRYTHLKEVRPTPLLYLCALPAL
jgi:hypothetical protein